MATHLLPAQYKNFTAQSQYEFHDETEEKRLELANDNLQRPKKKFRSASLLCLC